MFKPEEHLIKLKGKDYLQVMWRICWMRDEHPSWQVSTEMIHFQDNQAIFHATINDENGMLIAEGTGSETQKDFGDFIEKAETKAIGRALAYAGYGTQFTADELDEGNRLADSPVEIKKLAEEKAKRYENPIPKCGNCGQEIKAVGKCSAEEIAKGTMETYMRPLCWDCAKEMKKITTFQDALPKEPNL